ncbi:TraB/GumN family protein [Flaviaesturariibacter amylovorans]|uniref:TraB/GumN family protein n=1 Tax=Flaviaesturariibacter amylovorans TaxID=1084520 RepID=A0ABP8GDN9_9BACT
MRIVRRALWVCLVLLFANPDATAQAPAAKGLLWQISGNGLERPSYLWGTIHIKDRRVFHFTDSLYHFLSTTDAYAMEVDPDSTMAAVLRFMAAPDSTELLQTLLTKEQFRRVGPMLERELDMPAGLITRKKAWSYLQRRHKTPRRKDDMPESMDIYLQSIARSMGKIVGGIEDVEDQFDPAEILSGDVDVDALLGRDKSGDGFYEQLVQIYLAQDLTRIQRLSERMDSIQYDHTLRRRNRKMARRMDSLAHIRPTFFTVGAAHLPGADGVLALLRDRGFTVTAVRNGRKLPPGAFRFTPKAAAWDTVRSEPGTFRIEMPGKPEWIDLEGKNFRMQVFADVRTEVGYFSAAVPFPVIVTDSVLHVLLRTLSGGRQVLSAPARVLRGGVSGWESLTREKDMYYRLRLVPNGAEVAVLMAGGSLRERLFGADADRFFGSLQLLRAAAPPAPVRRDPYLYVDSSLAFSVSLPGRPTRNPGMLEKLGAADQQTWNVDAQAWIDTAGERYYILIVKETRPGFYIENDRELLEQSVRNVAGNDAMQITRNDTGSFMGYPALWLDARFTGNSGMELRTFHVNRGNRSFSLMHGGRMQEDDTAASSEFFNSLRFREYLPSLWAIRSDSAGRFRALAPSPFRRNGSIAEATLANGQVMRRYHAFDVGRNQTFYVDVRPLAPWRWYHSDSIFFVQQLDQYREASDSLVSEEPVSNGNLAGREYLLRTGDGATARLRVLPSGDSVFVLYAVTRPGEAYEGTQMFYESFRVAAPEPLRRDNGSLEHLLAALRSTDTLERKLARNALAEARFSAAHLPLLHTALLAAYPEADESEHSTPALLRYAVQPLSDSSTRSFVATRYPQPGVTSAVKEELLALLAAQKTDPAYRLLKQLILLTPPPSGVSATFTGTLDDSLALTRLLFPEVGALLADSSTAEWLLPVAQELIDSGLLAASDLAPYRRFLLQGAAQRIKGREAEREEQAWTLYTWISWLQADSSVESHALLQRMLRLPAPWLQRQAAIALLENGQTPGAAALQSLAARRSTRYYWYADLVRLKRTSLFPAAYRTQRALAESLLFNEASEASPDSIRYVGMREVTERGRKGRYFLFRMQYGEELFLGIAGPYPPEAHRVYEVGEAAGLSEEAYGSAPPDTLLRNWRKRRDAEAGAQ